MKFYGSPFRTYQKHFRIRSNKTKQIKKQKQQNKNHGDSNRYIFGEYLNFTEVHL